MLNDEEAIDAVRGIDTGIAFTNLVPGGSLVELAVNQYSDVQRLRAQVMLSDLLGILADGETGLANRIENDERVARIIAEASAAAAHSEIKAKRRALAAVVSEALRDDAAFDESLFLVSVLREVEVIDVRLLLAIEDAQLPSETGLDTAEALGVSEGVAQALNAKLLRLALVESPGMSFTTLHAKVRGSKLGAQLLALLRECGGTADVRS